MSLYEIIKIIFLGIACLIFSLVWILFYIDSKKMDNKVDKEAERKLKVTKDFEKWLDEKKKENEE